MSCKCQPIVSLTMDGLLQLASINKSDFNGRRRIPSIARCFCIKGDPYLRLAFSAWRATRISIWADTHLDRLRWALRRRRNTLRRWRRNSGGNRVANRAWCTAGRPKLCRTRNRQSGACATLGPRLPCTRRPGSAVGLRGKKEIVDYSKLECRDFYDLRVIYEPHRRQRNGVSGFRHDDVHNRAGRLDKSRSNQRAILCRRCSWNSPDANSGLARLWKPWRPYHRLPSVPCTVSFQIPNIRCLSQM